jgi:hypothetical protein
MYCHRAHGIEAFTGNMTTCSSRAEYRAELCREKRRALRTCEETVGVRAKQVLDRLKKVMAAGSDLVGLYKCVFGTT